MGEGDYDEQPKIQTDCRSRLIFGANFQSGPSSFDRS